MRMGERKIEDDGTMKAIVGNEQQRLLQERADASAAKFAETLRKLSRSSDGRDVS